MNKEIGMMLPKKELIYSSGVGESNNYYEDIYTYIYLLTTTPTNYNCLPYFSTVWMTILESGWNLCVLLMGVVSRRWVWLVGDSMGVVRMYI